MEIGTKVISTETIKPSSPTPKFLQKHHLSFIDQLMPPLFMSFVYFFHSNPKIPKFEKTKQLKKSLSEVLSRYYPLAGRLVGNLYVDCNDAGVPFSEAEADCDIPKVITNRNPKNLLKFLPCRIDEPQDFCMAVRATYLRCGGSAVGILISHKIADALSFLLFANTWSTVARNGDGGGVPLPKFNAAAYFPPRENSGFDFAAGIVKEELAARIFRFPASKIAALRERYFVVAGGGRRPSRVEALSAFIWTRLVSATGMRSDPNKICMVRNELNLRTRVDPALSEYHFGNIIWPWTAKLAAGDGGVEVVQKVREALKAIDGGYLARLKNGEIVAEADESELAVFDFSSLCGFPLYEADFGWGRPVWVGQGGFPYKNLIIFSDTENGGGIEALIHLTKQDMDKFEAHMELQMFKCNL